MLVVEKTANGRTIIVIKKDWHPGRISTAYIPKLRREYSTTEYRIQSALLRK